MAGMVEGATHGGAGGGLCFASCVPGTGAGKEAPASGAGVRRVGR